ncbi:MAG TPA: DsbA family protein [Candidatus Avacidaminococcus intestinavium]|uniref:DsbA family protein n=1 Tax=Candidatus Avacidaminococcus intestinavium TaxID=2840684 RepID=A0A9D1MNL8_9FIRM|nr:DsbA family protein [Candidatus Avacidaminococcus intestinavium]
MKTSLYYVMDPMCGWCYGISEVIGKIYDKYKEQMDFVILPGGMLIDQNIRTVTPEFAQFMQQNITQITKLTGQKFGANFEHNVLNHPATLDSLPGSKAITLMLKLNPTQALNYVKKVYHAFYVEGLDTNNWELYATLAEEFGITREDFKKAYCSPELETKTRAGFKQAQKLNVDTYPTIIALKNDQAHILAKGYMPFAELDELVSKYL